MYIKLGGPWGPQVLYTQLIFYIFKKSLKYKVVPLYFLQELNSKLSQLERVRFSQDFRVFLIVFDFFFFDFYFFGNFSIFGHRKIMKKSLFRQKRPFWAYFSFQRPVPVQTGSGSYQFRFIPVPVHMDYGFQFRFRFTGFL